MLIAPQGPVGQVPISMSVWACARAQSEAGGKEVAGTHLALEGRLECRQANFTKVGGELGGGVDHTALARRARR